MKIAGILEGWKKALMVPLVSIMFERTSVETNDAWQQAIVYVRGYGPQTEQEFRLVVRMAILNLEANHASMLSMHPETTVSQTIRLQANALALSKAADKAEARLKQLQSARIQRTPTQEAAPEPTETPPDSPKTSKEEARAISEFARRHKMTYAEAWALYQREKKADQALHAPTPQTVQTN